MSENYLFQIRECLSTTPGTIFGNRYRSFRWSLKDKLFDAEKFTPFLSLEIILRNTKQIGKKYQKRSFVNVDVPGDIFRSFYTLIVTNSTDNGAFKYIISLFCLFSSRVSLRSYSLFNIFI